MPEPVRLAELMCTRLCHDIANPLGTLTGMLELAQAQPGTSPPERAIPPKRQTGAVETTTLADLAAALEEMEGRLRLLRAAWGGDCRPLDLPRLRGFARCMPGADRIRLDLSALPHDTVFTPGIGRILINLLLFAPDVLPSGGAFVLAPADNTMDDGAAATGGAILLRLAGPRGAWPACFAGLLADPEAARAALREPQMVLAPWIALLAAHLGVRARLLMPTGRSAGPAPLLLQPRQPG